MVSKYLPENRRRELEHAAIIRRDQGHPPEQIAAEIAALGGISKLWAWRLAKGWTRSKLLERLRRTGDASVDESMLWRWETGEREPSREHLDRLWSVYQTRPDLLGYGPRLHPGQRRPRADRVHSGRCGRLRAAGDDQGADHQRR